jgi:hypothetical protein
LVDSERLFIRKMRGIADVVAEPSPDEYELIQASGAYRHILLDGLLASANREARLDVSIRTLPDHDGMQTPGTLLAWDAIAMSPRRAAPDADTVTLKPQQFEKRRAISLMFEAYTVYDVFIGSANFLGGVHHGVPTRQKELRLQHLIESAEEELLVVELSDGSTARIPAPIFPLLQEIGECLVDSLSPLVELLSARSN